jgi:hypothetical protein
VVDGSWWTASAAGVQPVPLPAFDGYYSEVSWFRDYAAYCGLSDDGERVFTVVAQLGKRRPLLKRAAGESGGNLQGKPCHAPSWLRAPARVTSDVPGEQKFTFTVRSHAVDLVAEDEENGGLVTDTCVTFVRYAA